MGRKNKIKKFADLKNFQNVFENNNFIRFDEPLMKAEKHPNNGLWKKNVFKNNQPIILELACGKGEYSVNLGQRYPDKNFIGVDIKGNRIWNGAKIALNLGLKNVAFLRTRIELLPIFFAKHEVDEIWITFPDPFLKKTRIKNRLTSMKFLNSYKKVLIPEGTLHLKTDDPTLYEYSLESILGAPEYRINFHHNSIYSLESLPHPDLDIKTFYERKHLAIDRKIKYIQFQVKNLKDN